MGMNEVTPSGAGAAYTYVDNDAAMGELLAWIAPAARAALDLEADSLHHYHEKICLMQLTDRGRHFLVDPLSPVDMGPFLEALAEKTLILHGSDYDLRMLRGLGFRPRGGLIDTMIAAQLAGRKELGLAALVAPLSGETRTKGGQKSDWSRRPLTAAQLNYAVEDTRFLEQLADQLLAELDGLGRREWFEQQCAALVAATATDRMVNPERQWRIRGVRDLGARQAAFVRELWRWREAEADRTDRPPFKILGNEPLVELAIRAEEQVRTGENRMPEIPHYVRGERLESLKTVLGAAARLEPADWPEPRVRATGERRRPGGGNFEQLRAAVAKLAGELGLEPAVLAPRAALEEISRLGLRDVAALQEKGRLLAWQAELLAPVVGRVMKGA
jgi:ribonuclease D